MYVIIKPLRHTTTPFGCYVIITLTSLRLPHPRNLIVRHRLNLCLECGQFPLCLIRLFLHLLFCGHFGSPSDLKSVCHFSLGVTVPLAISTNTSLYSSGCLK